MTDPVRIAEELAPGLAARAAGHDADAAFPTDVCADDLGTAPLGLDMVTGTDTRPW